MLMLQILKKITTGLFQIINSDVEIEMHLIIAQLATKAKGG